VTNFNRAKEFQKYIKNLFRFVTCYTTRKSLIVK
jgi:hypothetical protein